jgi:glycine/D-amino acid oxidase-like deaminating enzyme
MILCDVVICGGGAFGSFVAYLLGKWGVQTVVVSPTPVGAVFEQGLHCFWPSPNDPPTRADVAHGHDMAVSLNDFCGKGIEAFTKEFLPSLFLGAEKNPTKVPSLSAWQPAHTLRYAFESFEKSELNKAVDAKLGLSRTNRQEFFLDTQSALVGVSGSELKNAVHEGLKNFQVQTLEDSVVTLEETSKGCVLVTQNGERVYSEVAILGLGHHTGKLLPKYQEILVPMSDLCCELNGLVPEDVTLPSVLAVRSANGHVAGTLCVSGRNITVRVSGPRFILPQAGVGIDLSSEVPSAQLLQKSMAIHEKGIFRAFAEQLGLATGKEFLERFNLQVTKTSFGVDCLPCDELPLLGEFGRHGRVMGCAGWLGVGYSASAYAATIIAHAIHSGRQTSLDSRFSPRRFAGLS